MAAESNRSRKVLYTLCGVFVILLLVFSLDLLGRPLEVRPLPLVDQELLKTETWRRSYADLLAADAEELFNYDCYVCHEEDKAVTLSYDEDHKLVVPEEHANIVMDHGAHGRNNNCLNCHNPNNLLRLQARRGQDLKFEASSQLCGSCHGPTKEDWDAGAHGRTSGHWDPSAGERKRADCVNCHDPHAPDFPKFPPLPAPRHLSESVVRKSSTSSAH